MALHGIVSRTRRRRQGLRVDPQEDMITQAIRERSMRRRGFPHSTGLSFYQRPESQMLQDLMISKHGWAPQERLQRGGGGGGGRALEGDVQSGEFNMQQKARALAMSEAASGRKSRETIAGITAAGAPESEAQTAERGARTGLYQAQAQELGERGRRELERDTIAGLMLGAVSEIERGTEDGPMMTRLDAFLKEMREGSYGTITGAEGTKRLTSHDVITRTGENSWTNIPQKVGVKKPTTTGDILAHMGEGSPIDEDVEVGGTLEKETSYEQTQFIKWLMKLLRGYQRPPSTLQRYPIGGATRRPIPQLSR